MNILGRNTCSVRQYIADPVAAMGQGRRNANFDTRSLCGTFSHNSLFECSCCQSKLVSGMCIGTEKF